MNIRSGDIPARPPRSDADFRFDLSDPPLSFHDDPYATYRTLRAQQPVYRLPGGELLLTRHADVARVYGDTSCFSAELAGPLRDALGEGPVADHFRAVLVFTDGPPHDRVRSAMAQALIHRGRAAQAAALVDLRSLIDGLLADLAHRGAFDVMADFAAVLPVETICNLLDIPASLRPMVRGWSLKILAALEPTHTPAQHADAEWALGEFLAYLRELVADRRVQARAPDTDPLTQLIAATDAAPERGPALQEAELLHNCIFMLNAGHETLVNVICNGLHALAAWPGERDRLLNDASLIGTAVEELLRYDSSVQLEPRACIADSRVGGEAVAAGTRILLCIGGANRDPAVFADPDRLDVARTPNPHLAFGVGAHACLGAPIARREAALAITCFLRRFPRYELAGPPQRLRRVFFRGFTSLPVRVP